MQRYELVLAAAEMETLSETLQRSRELQQRSQSLRNPDVFHKWRWASRAERQDSPAGGDTPGGPRA